MSSNQSSESSQWAKKMRLMPTGLKKELTVKTMLVTPRRKKISLAISRLNKPLSTSTPKKKTWMNSGKTDKLMTMLTPYKDNFGMPKTPRSKNRGRAKSKLNLLSVQPQNSSKSAGVVDTINDTATNVKKEGQEMEVSRSNPNPKDVEEGSPDVKLGHSIAASDDQNFDIRPMVETDDEGKKNLNLETDRDMEVKMEESIISTSICFPRKLRIPRVRAPKPDIQNQSRTFKLHRFWEGQPTNNDKAESLNDLELEIDVTRGNDQTDSSLAVCDSCNLEIPSGFIEEHRLKSHVNYGTLVFNGMSPMVRARTGLELKTPPVDQITEVFGDSNSAQMRDAENTGDALDDAGESISSIPKHSEVLP